MSNIRSLHNTLLLRSRRQGQALARSTRRRGGFSDLECRESSTRPPQPRYHGLPNAVACSAASHCLHGPENGRRVEPSHRPITAELSTPFCRRRIASDLSSAYAPAAARRASHSGGAMVEVVASWRSALRGTSAPHPVGDIAIVELRFRPCLLSRSTPNGRPAVADALRARAAALCRQQADC